MVILHVVIMMMYGGGGNIDDTPGPEGIYWGSVIYSIQQIIIHVTI